MAAGEAALGPKPWRIDMEGSEYPVKVAIVAADERVAFTLVMANDYSLARGDYDEVNAIWEAGLQLAEQITGASRYAPVPRMDDGTHLARYYSAREKHHSPNPLRSPCPQCGEVEGDTCS